MKSTDLNRSQVERMQAVVRPMLGYLSQLTARMNRVAFEPNDRLFLAAVEAYNAVHSLNVLLHYLACDAFKRERKPE